MNNCLLITPASSYDSLPDGVRDQWIELIRTFLRDQTANPIAAVTWYDGQGGAWYVANYAPDSVLADLLTPEAVAMVNAQITEIGSVLIVTADPLGELAARGLRPPVVDVVHEAKA